MRTTVFLLMLTIAHGLCSQQLADTIYSPPIERPAYLLGEGPVVFIDEAHHNFHTKEGRYKAFSTLLERDGYDVQPYTSAFEKNELVKGKLLVISNALHESNVQDWSLPNPSAFTPTEIETVKQWVFDGGRMFLIADHMPMAGAAADLAKAFGFGFTNGFAMDTVSRGPAFFNRKEGTLHENSITKGRNPDEQIEQVATFTGQAFKIPDDATPILTFSNIFVNLLPETAWVFNENTTKYSVEGWSQGAYKPFGKGRVVVFGEAAMFTAQIAGPQQSKMGMNNAVAPENHQLLLNIIHWLDGKLD